MLFDDQTLRKLEQLSLVASRVRVGMMKGERRSRKKGTSIEFADYRNYVQGDDLRRLDWNIFARLERPFVKLLEEEEDLAVHILVDSSGSMAWPEGADQLNKYVYARRLTAALAHIGLATGDQVIVTLLNSRENRRWGPHRGRQNTTRLLSFLDGSRPSGITDLNLALKNYATLGQRPGLLFLLSDLFSPHGFEQGLLQLLSRGYEIGLIHLLSPDEADPSPGGDVRLVDVESGAEAEVTLDASTIDLYRKHLKEWVTGVSQYCRRRGIHYSPAITDYPWDKLVLQTLRTQGVLE